MAYYTKSEQIQEPPAGDFLNTTQDPALQYGIDNGMQNER